MELMSIVSFLIDVVLIIMAVWMLTLVLGYSGSIGRAFNIIGVGVLILGITHILETIILKVFGFGYGAVELLHRLLVLVGFSLIIIGFRMIVKNK